MINIEELKKLALAAEPGPWEIKNDSTGDCSEAYCHWHRVGPFELMGKTADEDSRFIAAANPAVILELIERLERAEHGGNDDDCEREGADN